MPILDDKMMNGLAIFASGYAKRWMEDNYDMAMSTGPGQKLKALPTPAKYALEAGLYALMAYADQKLSSDTPLKKFFKEVAKDAPPEIAKRFINGVKKDIEHDAQTVQRPEQKAALQTLLMLDDATLSGLLQGVAGLSELQRTALAASLSGLNEDQLRKLATLNPEQLGLVASLMQTNAPPAKPLASEPAPASPTALQGLAESLEQMRGRLQAKQQEMQK